MTAILINPKLIINRKDKFTTGIVYMPIALAYINSILLKSKINTKIIDLFGSNPNKVKINQNKLELGNDLAKYDNILSERDAVYFLYANQVINHDNICETIAYLNNKYPHNKIVLIENTQAVTAYSLRKVKNDFLKIGVDIIICGDPEIKVKNLYKKIVQNEDYSSINNIITSSFDNSKNDNIEDIDELPFPEWHGFNLENYWSLKHAHGPLTKRKYMPILTSRGCPYACKFCVIPTTTYRSWRGRSAKNVVDEIEVIKNKYNVTEFHLEDLNPTVNEKRTIQICEELINRNLKINWKIVSGTKIESIKSLKTIDLMKKSGCTYISISPESGSTKVMQLIDKPFDLNHGKKLIQRMNLNKIKSQACFVLGFPGENDEDRMLTKKIIQEFTRNGLDEIAVFIITPIPGSEIYSKFSGFNSYSELNFSPIWRDDYKKLNKFRINLYRLFILNKLIFFPLKIFKQIFNFLFFNFETKMEMVPFKAMKLLALEFRAKF
jgi:anaerobic magnesium-protoporphyrin IX monomethyl ester cyclase